MASLLWTHAGPRGVTRPYGTPSSRWDPELEAARAFHRAEERGEARRARRAERLARQEAREREKAARRAEREARRAARRSAVGSPLCGDGVRYGMPIANVGADLEQATPQPNAGELGAVLLLCAAGLATALLYRQHLRGGPGH